MNLFQAVENEIPARNKVWVGVYDKNRKNLLGSVRLVHGYPSPVELAMKKRGINFKVADLLDKKYPDYQEIGRAFRLNEPSGDDAKKIWELFLGMGQDHIYPTATVVHTDAQGAILFDRLYGLKVKKRVYKVGDDWKILEQEKVNHKIDEASSEYILIGTGNQIKYHVQNRILTDKSYWDLFKREPGIRKIFEKHYVDNVVAPI